MIEADARDWLEGGDPFATRSNYSIAKHFADKKPGHSYPAIMLRIERKLSKNRAWITLATAMEVSREGYPHAAHVRALEALVGLGAHTVWAQVLERARSEIADYEARNGAPPPAHLSMLEVEEATRNALLALRPPAKPVGLGGLLGALSSYKPSSGAEQ